MQSLSSKLRQYSQTTACDAELAPHAEVSSELQSFVEPPCYRLDTVSPESTHPPIQLARLAQRSSSCSPKRLEAATGWTERPCCCCSSKTPAARQNRPDGPTTCAKPKRPTDCFRATHRCRVNLSVTHPPKAKQTHDPVSPNQSRGPTFPIQNHDSAFSILTFVLAQTQRAPQAEMLEEDHLDLC